MFVKVNPIEIIRNHWSTFVDADEHPLRSDWLLFYLFPVLGGGIVWYLRPHFLFSEATYGLIVNILAIFIPLAFTALTQLYVVVEKYRRNVLILKLIRHLFYNLAYSIFCALCLLVLFLLADFLNFKSSHLFSSIVLAIGIHLFLTILMILKRFNIIMLRVVEDAAK